MLSNMSALTRGIVVFIALAIITVIEYVVGIENPPVLLMVFFALLKAGLVIWFFMHIFRVFNPHDEEGGH